jgi:hypothetical protein
VLQGKVLTQSRRGFNLGEARLPPQSMQSRKTIHDIVFHIIQSKTFAQSFDRAAPECIFQHLLCYHQPDLVQKVLTE